MRLRRAAGYTLVALVLLHCRAPAPTPSFATGSLGPLIPELQRLEKSGFAVAWLRPDVSLTRYRAVQLVYPELSYRSERRSSSRDSLGRDSYSLSPRFTRELMAALENSFAEELVAPTGWRPIATGESAQEMAGSETAVGIRVALVDLLMHAPLLHPGGDDKVWVDSIGAVTVVIDLFDVASHRMLARFAERRVIEPQSGRAMRATPGSSRYEARQLFSHWAWSLRRALEALEQAGAMPAPATPAPAG